MHQFSGKLILMMLLFSVILGALVVLFVPGYSIKENIASNENYYPSVKATEE